MSSKLVKKGLEFVSSNDTKQQQKVIKKSKKQRQRNAPYLKGKQKRKGEQKSHDQDFTQQNLRYYTSSVWSMKKDMYEKIVENQDKRKTTHKETEELEDKDEFHE